MKKVFFVLMITGFVLPLRLFSLELELAGGLGNIAFDKDRKSALSDKSAAGAFDPELFPLALVKVSGEREGLFWNAGFERDPVLRNRLFGNVKFELDYFSFEAGSFIGLFNSGKRPFNPGISANAGFSLPGVVFARAGGSSTLTALMDIEKNYFQTIETGDVSLGFWVPFVICSLNLSLKNYIDAESANLLIEDEQLRWFFSADVYTKNIPFTIKVDLGYQKLSRSYISRAAAGGTIENVSAADEFKSVFAGVEAAYTLNSALKFTLGGEMPVYSWAVRPMKDPPDNTMLFKARAGVVWTLR